MQYVDGFVVAVPKQKLDAYKAIAQISGDIWKEYGALEYVECVGDDVPYGKLTSFPRAVQATDDEVVVFSWIVYDSREKRDEVMKKVMDDPRIKETMNDMPFDTKRMIFGGFKTLLQLYGQADSVSRGRAGGPAPATMSACTFQTTTYAPAFAFSAP